MACWGILSLLFHQATWAVHADIAEGGGGFLNILNFRRLIDAYKWCTLHSKANYEETTWYLFCDWRKFFFCSNLVVRSSFYIVFTTKTRQTTTTYLYIYMEIKHNPTYETSPPPPRKQKNQNLLCSISGGVIWIYMIYIIYIYMYVHISWKPKGPPHANLPYEIRPYQTLVNHHTYVPGSKLPSPIISV